MKYVAQLQNVRELKIVGNASLAFWSDHLRGHGLTPANHDGEARLWIVAADGVFRGLRFQELSVCVLLDDGAFLVEAFNSRRFFAFCERFFFSTPYRHGEVEMNLDPRPSIRVTTNDKVVFSAEKKSDTTAVTTNDPWEGAVFLPSGKVFHAKLGGIGAQYPFQSPDTIEINTIASHFVPKTWTVKHDATHAKSKTYRR